jgi:hypothetical protein
MMMMMMTTTKKKKKAFRRGTEAFKRISTGLTVRTPAFFAHNFH